MSHWIEQHWQKRTLVSTALLPLSLLFAGLAAIRRGAYGIGLLRAKKLPVPVVVIGNISVGGTGKTPLTIHLANHLRQLGLRPGIISRGYGGSAQQATAVHSDSPADLVGDEPILIARHTGCPVYVCRDRAAAGLALLAAHPECNLLLCDDGLQHYRLARDLELVLIDAARGLGNGRCLPEGPLREPVERLQSVDACLFNGAAQDSEAGFAFRLNPTELVNLSNGERASLNHFPPGQALHAVAGIGNPQRFFTTLKGLNWQPVEHPFADHAPLSAELLRFAPPLPLVMTEKDAVKCRHFAAPDWWYLAVQAQPSAAFVAWLDGELQRLLPGRL